MKILAFCTLLLIGVMARISAAPPALVVILLPGTSLHDWQSAEAPNLHRLMQTGALAVMNTRTAHLPGDNKRETPESALLTLGAGARAAGRDNTGFLPTSAPAPGMALSCGALFERRTGVSPRADRRVCPDWPAVLAANRDPGYDLRPGTLADTLAAHGFTVAAGGGPDADWVAAGNAGIVRRTANLEAASGMCVIWDAGSDLAAADAVIGAAGVQAAATQGRLIILSPYASRAAYARNERLTPALLWGAGVPAGVITSPSTRRLGLVTNTDFAPTVGAYFGIKRTEFRPAPFGFAWSAAASPDHLQTVAGLSEQSVRQAQGMRGLPYSAAALGAWILVGTLLSRRQPIRLLWLLVPTAAIVSALFAVSLISFCATLLGILAAVPALTCFVSEKRVLLILTGGASAALMIDMVTGNRLMHSGLLGYSAIEGARYYGIGNEAMGLMMGSALIFTAGLWRFQQARPALMGLLVAIAVLLGSAGAKAGGVLVLLAVFGTFLGTVSGRRWTPKTITALGALVVAGMAVAALGDAFLRPTGQSHIGEAVQRILSGGAGEAGDIVRRKLAVEGRLAYHSAWAILLWTGIVCTGFLWRQMPVPSRDAAALRSAGAVGIAACLLLNDAGVVAAALFSALLWSEAMVQKHSLPASDYSEAGRLKE